MWTRRAAALVAALLLTACASSATRSLPPQMAAVELEQTPFFAQADYQCGPAALATVLAASGLEVLPRDLVSQVYVPGRHGSFQAEMVAAARRYQRVPVPLPQTLEAIVAELQGGRPVLVFLNLGLRILPVWHYAVVVGYDPATRSLVLRSGRERRERMSIARFDAAWQRAERWAVTLTTAAAIPASATLQGWIAASAPFESLGQWAVAESAYRAAAERWPQAALPQTALGNVQAAQRKWLPAVAAYTVALKRAVDAGVLNNRASALMELGCLDAARSDLDRARELAPAIAVGVSLQRTRSQLGALSADGIQRTCPQAVRELLAQ